MYIGKVAEQTGATHRAIRLYEAMGLIPAPARQGRYRVYSEQDVVLIQMIRRAQQAGFGLAEIRAVVNEKAQSGRFPLTTVLALIANKRDHIAGQRQRLDAQEEGLRQLELELVRTYR